LAITQIEAQELLLDIRVSQYPWLKKDGQRSTHRQFHKLAYPTTHDASAPVTTEELAERLRAAING
jgi:hypothetical protein